MYALSCTEQNCVYFGARKLYQKTLCDVMLRQSPLLNFGHMTGGVVCHLSDAGTILMSEFLKVF